MSNSIQNILFILQIINLNKANKWKKTLKRDANQYDTIYTDKDLHIKIIILEELLCLV